jgi:ribosome biogenesis GTPase
VSPNNVAQLDAPPASSPAWPGAGAGPSSGGSPDEAQTLDAAQTYLGTVVRAVSNFYDVLPDAVPDAAQALDLGEAGVVRCRAREKLRKNLVLTESKSRAQRVRDVRRRSVTDPIAIGDRVRFVIAPTSGREVAEGAIEEVLPRSRELARQAVTTGTVPVGQVLVANLDLVMVVFAAAAPPPSFGMVDRFLVSCESRALPAVLCLNKVDLGIAEDVARAFHVYERAGYRVLRVSAATGEGLDALRALVRDKISAFVGPSGVGKSTLLNALQPGLGLRVGEISRYTGKGTHTTRFSQLVPLSFGGFLADTPGLRALGLWEVSDDELDRFFPEFRPYLGQCRFGNCAHVGETECAVQDAVARGAIDQRRYASYVKLFAEG